LSASLDRFEDGDYNPVMKVVDIANIQRKENLLYYRREYSGEATLELLSDTLVAPIEFVLEQRPVGGYSVHVNLVDTIDYPLVPIISALKAFIAELDLKGELP
jgi:hypothetical protein